MDGEAYLINTSYVQDDIGAWHKQESERRIFVSEKSMGRSEWYNAGRNGFKPEIVLTTQSINYSGEEKVKYKNHLYSIYRTYQKENFDEIELYLTEKAENNVKEGSC